MECRRYNFVNAFIEKTRVLSLTACSGLLFSHESMWLVVLNSCEPIIFDICAWFGQLWDETKFAFSHLLLSEYNKLNTCDPDKTQRRC